MADADCHSEALQRHTLRWLLAINACMFVAELVMGLLVASTALIADAMDMLADASVYLISMFAVGKRLRFKNRAATISGYLQILLGLLVIAEVGRRLFTGSTPEPLQMLIVGLVALGANLFCLKLIWQHRRGQMHMRASWIFTVNDVLANIAVIMAAILVWWLDHRLPDLIVGTLIALIVIRGGMQILREARQSSAQHQ